MKIAPAPAAEPASTPLASRWQKRPVWVGAFCNPKQPSELLEARGSRGASVGEIVSAAVPDAMTILGSDQVKTILENLVEEPQKARRTPSCPTYRPTPLAMK